AGHTKVDTHAGTLALQSKASSSHFEQFNRIQLPAGVNARKDQNCGTRVLYAQLFRLQGNVDSDLIRVQLFRAEHTRLPNLRLGSHGAANEFRKFAGHDKRCYFSLASTPN